MEEQKYLVLDDVEGKLEGILTQKDVDKMIVDIFTDCGVSEFDILDKMEVSADNQVSRNILSTRCWIKDGKINSAKAYTSHLPRVIGTLVEHEIRSKSQLLIIQIKNYDVAKNILDRMNYNDIFDKLAWTKGPRFCDNVTYVALDVH